MINLPDHGGLYHLPEGRLLRGADEQGPQLVHPGHGLADGAAAGRGAAQGEHRDPGAEHVTGTRQKYKNDYK